MKQPKSIKTANSNFLAIQWNGLDLPGDFEGFEDFGYFEHENGYDLESCDYDFPLENERKHGYVRSDEWIIKDKKTGKYSACSNEYFKKTFLGIME